MEAMADEEKIDYRSVDLQSSQFIDEKTGTAMLPSLITSEDEQNFKIDRDFYLKGFTNLRESVRQIRRYEIADQYNNVLDQMDGQTEYWLKFIGMFKSVQMLQLYRNAHMFPTILDDSRIKKSLYFLMKNGLIVKWKYYHPINESEIPVYTLSGNGYRLLMNFYKDNYFHPQNFWNLDDRYHLRFWETLDVYQILVSLPAYHASSTLFKGKPLQQQPLMPSPLQVNLELIKGKPKNLVIYPALHNDYENYYKDAVMKWAKYIDAEQSLDFQINKLPKAQNVLTFYTPTLKRAYQLDELLKLKDFKFPCLFLVGTSISNEGIDKAFFVPNRREEGLRQVHFENILKENEFDNDKS